MAHLVLPTRKVVLVASGDVIIINESDFDTSKHTPYEEPRVSVESVGDMKTVAAVAKVESATTVEELNAHEASENAAKGRSKVLDAIAAKREELGTSSNEE